MDSISLTEARPAEYLAIPAEGRAPHGIECSLGLLTVPNTLPSVR
ncbi:hypothetical protein [Mycobacterium sp.]|nr:hypothetical protein [Mycobacterium sp.]